MGDSVHQSLCVALAHTAKTDDGNVQPSGRCLGRHVVKGVHDEEW